MILTWRSWFFSASSHMTSVTKRNILDSMGEARGRSYTPHKHHPLGWIFLQGKMWFFYFFRKHCLHKVLNLHQLPNGAYRCYNCVTHILPTPCTSLTYVAEKVLLRQGKNGKNRPENFCGPKTVTFAKSTHLWDPKNCTSSGQIKILRPLL